MNLNEIFVYDERSPSCLVWLNPLGDKKKKGDFAGGVNWRGYWVTQYKTKKALCHRIIWEMINGKIPFGMEIDHISGNQSDNRISNLRLATPMQNKANTSKRSTNRSGYKGVQWNKKDRKFRALFIIGKENRFLGNYDCPVLAAEAYDREAIRVHGEFARLNFPLID